VSSHRFRPLSRLTTFGLIALALAGIVRFLTERHTAWPESVTDPVNGFLYGVAIGAMLLGIWRQSRGMSSDCA
jgi:peptidoglycan/LPS O-acetylase OafA/YrhL